MNGNFAVRAVADTMNRTFVQRSVFVAGSLLLALAAHSALSEPQTFSIAFAVLDKDIPESVREAFEDDDGKPMKSVSADLDNDNHPEKLIPNEFLCGNGGCPWLVYSPKLDKVIGRLFGNTIVILDTSTEGYKRIHAGWSLGADKTATAGYEFRNGAYEQEAQKPNDSFQRTRARSVKHR